MPINNHSHCLSNGMACTGARRHYTVVGSWAPVSMPITPDAVLPRRAGIVNGDTYECGAIFDEMTDGRLS